MDQVLGFIASPGMLQSYVVVAVTIVLLGVMRRLFTLYKRRSGPLDLANSRKDRLTKTCYDTAKYIVMFLALLLVLQMNGIDIGAMVTGLGVAGIVVGFALQDTLKDLIMGTHILTDRFYSMGDVVRYQGVEGEVISFTPQTTKIRSIVDNSILCVSNRNISEITVSSNQFDIDVPLPYEVEAVRIDEVLECCARRIAQVEGIEDCAYLGTQEFGDSAISYKLRLFCAPKDRPPLRRSALRIIQEELAACDIAIPYNQLDVHQVQAPS